MTKDLLSLDPSDEHLPLSLGMWYCYGSGKDAAKTPFEGNESRRGKQACSTWHRLFARRATHPTVPAAPQPSAGLTAVGEVRVLFPLALAAGTCGVATTNGKLVNLTSGNSGD